MRILVFFLTLTSLALAVERPTLQDFAACYERNKASVLVYEGMQAFALGENLLAVIKTPTQKLNKYVKYDPFLNLYLVRTDFSLFPAKTYDEQNLTRNDWVGIIDPAQSYIGHLKYLGQNINERDQLDFVAKVGQLNTPCCSMLGITFADGSFIGNRYLNHFKKYNDVYWGDIGVDFAVRDNKIYVENVRKSGQFLINDEIASVDGKKYNDLRELNEKILFSDRGATLYFNILRDNQDVNISAQIQPKELSDLAKSFGQNFALNVQSGPKNTKPKNPTLQTNLGLTVDHMFTVIRVSPNSKASESGFLVGDKILRVNNQRIITLQILQKIFASENDFNILVARKANKLPISNRQNQSNGDGIFQFFIRLTK